MNLIKSNYNEILFFSLTLYAICYGSKMAFNNNILIIFLIVLFYNNLTYPSNALEAKAFEIFQSIISFYNISKVVILDPEHISFEVENILLFIRKNPNITFTVFTKFAFISDNVPTHNQQMVIGTNKFFTDDYSTFQFFEDSRIVILLSQRISDLSFPKLHLQLDIQII